MVDINGLYRYIFHPVSNKWPHFYPMQHRSFSVLCPAIERGFSCQLDHFLFDVDLIPPLGHSKFIKFILISLKFLFNSSGPVLPLYTIANNVGLLYMLEMYVLCCLLLFCPPVPSGRIFIISLFTRQIMWLGWVHHEYG